MVNTTSSRLKSFFLLKFLFDFDVQKTQPTLNSIRSVLRAFGFAVQSAYGGADVSDDFDEKLKKKRKKKQVKIGAIDDPECEFFFSIDQIFSSNCFFFFVIII